MFCCPLSRCLSLQCAHRRHRTAACLCGVRAGYHTGARLRDPPHTSNWCQFGAPDGAVRAAASAGGVHASAAMRRTGVSLNTTLACHLICTVRGPPDCPHACLPVCMPASLSACSSVRLSVCPHAGALGCRLIACWSGCARAYDVGRGGYQKRCATRVCEYFILLSVAVIRCGCGGRCPRLASSACCVVQRCC